MIARLHATAAAVVILCMFAATAFIIARHPNAPLIVVPIMATLVWILFAVAPFVTPRGRNLLGAQSVYGTIWLGATSVLAVTFAVVAARALGEHLPRAVDSSAMGTFLIVAGNICGKLPPNYIAGIRTPWALADDEIWDKTQRFGGWCLVIAGFITINAALLLEPQTARHVMLGLLLVVLAIVTFASWNWARLKSRSAPGK
ncbi:MAG: SdpI family protein [Alphaproteobacteria bacterium]|nr:SdpI family protein [Alphaproteobacteria bacterium]MBL6939595.1 SdpI family protein [Alphaproteobacteria bacterium]MBL7100032.1 SdpI family protein [Alphaproteobacteria bacterium]